MAVVSVLLVLLHSKLASPAGASAVPVLDDGTPHHTTLLQHDQGELQALQPQSPCASVLAPSGAVVRRFCGTNSTVLQSALDFAAASRQSGYTPTVVRCTGGTFWVAHHREIEGLGYTAAVIVPSNIHLIGASSTAPGSRTTVKPALDVPAAYAGLYLAMEGINITVERMEVDAADTNGTRLFGIGIAATNGTSSHVLHNYVHHTAADGIQLGYWFGNAAQHDGNVTCTQHWNGRAGAHSTVIGNRVEFVGWDGIEVDGQHVTISNNSVYYAMNVGHSNGITCFIGSMDILVENNRIEMVCTGIGMDGSFPPGCAPGLPSTVETGCGYNMTIRNNTIVDASNGVVLWRHHGSLIVNNTLVSRALNNTGMGVLLNNARDNWVAGNSVEGFLVGVSAEGGGDPGQWPGGSYNNTIGALPDARPVGNHFTNNKLGLQVFGNATCLVVRIVTAAAPFGSRGLCFFDIAFSGLNTVLVGGQVCSVEPFSMEHS